MSNKLSKLQMGSSLIQKMAASLLLIMLAVFPIHAAIDKESIDAHINTYVSNQPIKAIIYGLWVDGKPISIRALGDSMTQVPATTEMHFRIGGVTETLLTTSLMQLVEKKKLKLDDKVARWFPELPNANKVTLKMLANGTSGFPDYVHNKKFVETLLSNPFKEWSEKDILDYAFMESPVFEPGTNQSYSHTDYVILGSIISQSSNKNLDKVFRSLILKPLSMKETHYNLKPNIASPVLHAYTEDRGLYEESSFWSPSWTSSSGSMTSTIYDLGLWANAWMKGRLLTKQSVKQLRAPDTVGLGNNREDLYFAMGFLFANHWLVQNPSFGGYSGIFAVLPEKKMVFIAFMTVKPDAAKAGHLGVKLLKELVPELAPDYSFPDI